MTKPDTDLRGRLTADAAQRRLLRDAAEAARPDLDAGPEDCECHNCLRPITAARSEFYGRCCSSSCLASSWL